MKKPSLCLYHKIPKCTNKKSISLKKMNKMNKSGKNIEKKVRGKFRENA